MATTEGKIASPGDTLDRVDTPALILELDAFEDNLRAYSY